MAQLVLYSTLGCHLCELAQDEIHGVIKNSEWRLHEVDIADDPLLMEQYGVRIPVLYNPLTQNNLFWPFDQEAVKLFLSISE